MSRDVPATGVEVADVKVQPVDRVSRGETVTLGGTTLTAPHARPTRGCTTWTTGAAGGRR